MLTAVVVVTILVLASCSAMENMGKCTKNPDKDTKFDFKQFAGENKGKWCVVRGPKTTFNSDLKSLSYLITMKGSVNCGLRMYYQSETTVLKNPTAPTNPVLFTEEEMTSSGGGVAHSSGIVLEICNHIMQTMFSDEKKETFTLTISFIKYVPKRYVYYYICSPKGADTSIDYRYVLAYSELKQNEVDDINKIDQENGFKGELIPIGTSNC